MTRRYRTIDADGHVNEPADLWRGPYMDPEFRDRGPQLLAEADGSERLVVEDVEKVFEFGLGFSFGTRRLRDKPMPYASRLKGGFDPHARMPDMDAEGVDASFLYPSLGVAVLGRIKDPALAAAVCRSYNLWLADYCAPYPDRLFGVGMVPIQSVELAVQEARYARETLGMSGVFLRPNPVGKRQLHDREWDPFWAAAQDLDLAVGIHEGGAMQSLAADRFEGGAARHAVSHTLEMIAACTSVIMCGVCERFPRLRFGFMESGGGWMAGWLDRMDRHFDGPTNDTGLAMRPSEYFRRQCWISFEPVEACLAVLAEYIGPHKILWATDYPHVDGFPGAVRMIATRPGLSEETRRRVLAEGAIRFYNMGDPADLMEPARMYKDNLAMQEGRR